MYTDRDNQNDLIDGDRILGNTPSIGRMRTGSRDVAGSALGTGPDINVDLLQRGSSLRIGGDQTPLENPYGLPPRPPPGELGLPPRAPGGQR